MAVKTEKASEVKELTSTPTDNDKILGYNSTNGTGFIKLSTFFNWIKNKTRSTITAGNKEPVNSDAVNSAINNLSITSADLESSETAGVNKFTCPRGGVFTLNYLRKQTVGNIRYYIGKVTIGSDASGGNLYFGIDGLIGGNGWVVDGTWEILNSEYKGVLFIANNNSIWLQKGETTGAERLASTEAQNKTITFRFTATKIETVSPASEE